jgi:hypothetical protein
MRFTIVTAAAVILSLANDGNATGHIRKPFVTMEGFVEPATVMLCCSSISSNNLRILAAEKTADQIPPFLLAVHLT